MEQIAQRNISLQKRINTISGIVFLLPVITLLYTSTGLTTREIIIVSNVASACMRLFELPTSVLADTFGRRSSMIASICANFFGALCLFFFPTYSGFIIASVFAALYASFWSGTGQAFLEENLSVLGRKHEYGKVIGDFMFWENIAGIATPTIASLILSSVGDGGYMILAGLDLFFATALIPLTYSLKNLNSIHIGNFKMMRRKNIDTAKLALKNVFGNAKSKILLVYRTFGNTLAYFPLLILPLLMSSGMSERFGGIVITISAVGLGVGLKINEWFSDRYSYSTSRLFSHGMQGALMIIAGVSLMYGAHRYLIACIYVLFYTLDGFRRPSRNHILVHNSHGGAIATTRSIIFSMYALWATIGKQLLGLMREDVGLMLLGAFLILITGYMIHPMKSLEE